VFGKEMKLTAAVSMTGLLGADGNPLSDVSEFASYLDYIQIMAVSPLSAMSTRMS